MPKTAVDPSQLSEIYKDNQKCANLVGLSYSLTDSLGFSRKKHGKGFRFFDDSGQPVSDGEMKKRLAELVIPPAWQEVWICPKPDGHILVTGLDERGRKQYIYHPKWRQVRDLLKFYRLIIFGKSLPTIRKTINKHLQESSLTYNRVLACMLWILDNTYIRIGNDVYLVQNESVGLTTLSDQNVVVAGPVVTFSFKGKSGKEQTIVLEDPTIAGVVSTTKALKGERLFQYQDRGQNHIVTANHINNYLREITGEDVSAKDFRTWGGTLMAFNHLVEERDSDKKPEKLAVEAVDAAANVLGNTRAIARSSYVHPHILRLFTKAKFNKYYDRLKRRSSGHLDSREQELLQFLEELFKQEFDLLQATQ